MSTMRTLPKGVSAPRTCHRITEVIPNLFLFDKARQESAVFMGMDVLVPLDSISESIWDWGFQGQVYGCPIPDGGVLPIEILERSVKDIAGFLNEGKRVGVFCIGGHGRTGYLASAIIGTLFPGENPVRFIRTEYCTEVVETFTQLEQIESFLGIQIDDMPSHGLFGGYLDNHEYWDKYYGDYGNGRGSEDIYDTNEPVFVDYTPLYEDSPSLEYVPYTYCKDCDLYEKLPCDTDKCSIPWPSFL